MTPSQPPNKQSELCDHKDIYFKFDNFYCGICNQGMGNAYYQLYRQLTQAQKERDEARGENGKTCQTCNWTNTGCLNISLTGRPNWICHGCIARAIEKTTQLSTILKEVVEDLKAIAANKTPMSFDHQARGWMAMKAQKSLTKIDEFLKP